MIGLTTSNFGALVRFRIPIIPLYMASVMVLLGYLVFGDLPDTAVVFGAAIVIASGGYLLYRERTSVKAAA